MKNLKLLMGIVLVIISVAAFVFWEVQGRDLVFEENMVVASQAINDGEILSEDNLTIRGIENDALIENGVKASDLSKLTGRVSGQYIPAGAQLCEDYLTDSDNLVIGKNQSIFCINDEDIDMVSSSLRRGDVVRIYGNSGKEDLGRYAVAFVKDKSDREVKNQEVMKNDRPLDRENSNYSISSVEIVCTKEQYAVISDFLSLSDEGLTIVQEVE